MLYFAYGSNLNHHQMKNIRCVGSKYLKSFFLKDFKMIFSHPNKLNKFGYANIVRKKGSKVAGLEMQDLESMGHVKFDVLGINFLDKIMKIKEDTSNEL